MITTGSGLLMRGELRPDVCAGDVFEDVVGTHSACLAGGGWLDAPYVFAAGGMRRAEEWTGDGWRARPAQMLADRF